MLSDTTYLNPQTIISNGQYTGSPWTNPNNLLTVNGQYASTPSTSTLGSDVVVGNFLFNIPQNSNIAGIEISFTGYRGASASPATALEVYAYDNTNGNNFFYLLTPVFSSFSTIPVTYYFGSPSFLFNTTWTADQINNLKLRLQGNGELYIDNVQVRVTYQAPGSSSPVAQNVCESIFQSQPFQLIAPVSASGSDVNWLLDKFQTSDGVDITALDIIAPGIPITVDQGTPAEENGYVTNVVSTAGNQRIITVSRGWSFRDPNVQSAPLRQHGATAKVEIANSIQFYDIFLRKCQIGSLVSAPITVSDEGAQIATYARSFNFVGAGVVATATPASSGGGQDIRVVIPGFTTNPPTLDNSLSFSSGGVQVNTWTVPAFTVSGTNRWMIFKPTIESTRTITAVTFNGIPLVFSAAKNNGDVRVESWILTAPALGTHPLVITLSGLSYLEGDIASFNAVDQSVPWTPGGTNSGHSTTSSGSDTTVTENSIVLHLVGTKEVGINYTPGGGESLFTRNLVGAVQGGIESQNVGTPATVTSNVALSISTDWANILGSINGVTPPSLSNLTVEDEGIVVDSAVVLMNFIGTGVTVTPNGAGNVDVTIPGSLGNDHFVGVDAADTTPDYLDPKLHIHSSDGSVTVTKTITNPAGNEVLDFDLTGAGSGGGSGAYTVNADEAVSAAYTMPLYPRITSHAGTQLPWDAALLSPVGFIMGAVAASGTVSNWGAVNGTDSIGLNFNTSKQTRLKFLLDVSDGGAGNTATLAFGFGGLTDPAAFRLETDTTLNSIKFVWYRNINANNLYAVVSNGVAVTAVALAGITINQTNLYEIVWKPGTTSVQFWVNGVLKTTINTNVPTANQDCRPMSANFTLIATVWTPTIGFEL